MRQELCGLDPPDCVLYQAAKFLALLVGDGSLQILNFDHSLANENHLSNFGNSSHPGVANELEIQRQ